MKKILAICMTVALSVSALVGCGSKTEEAKTDAVKVIDINLTQEEYAFGVDKDQPELLEQTNEFVAKIKEDGTLDKICEKYFGGGEPTAVKSAEMDDSKADRCNECSI